MENFLDCLSYVLIWLAFLGVLIGIPGFIVTKLNLCHPKIFDIGEVADFADLTEE